MTEGDLSARTEQQDWNIDQVADALGVPPEATTSDAWGMGTVFRIGTVQPVAVELYPDTRAVRVTGQDMQVSLFRQDRPPAPAAEGGIAFELNGEPAGRFLSVSPRGEVLFQYDPGTAAGATPRQEPHRTAPAAPAPEANRFKPKSEKYVGRMGEVRTHRTKAGKLVAEVELTVNDPEQPGSSRLVKFAAFDLMAEVLQKSYQPGQLVTAVGIPHELTRRTRDGREYVERQLYFVRPPKLR